MLAAPREVVAVLPPLPLLLLTMTGEDVETPPDGVAQPLAVAPLAPAAAAATAPGAAAVTFTSDASRRRSTAAVRCGHRTSAR